MKRDFYNTKITQRSSDKYFNATELMQFYNKTSDRKKVMAEFWQTKNTKEYLKALSDSLNANIGENQYLERDLYTTTRGVGGGTFMHPFLFIKFAMWLSPEFEVQIIKWVYDNLIDFRKQAGNHYREMCEAIADRYEDYYDRKANPLVFQNEANFLNKLVFGSIEPKKRNSATEKQLEILNQLQLANIHLIKSKTSLSERKRRLTELAELIKL